MKKPLKVFILAGQSNMEGHGFIAADPARNAGKGSLEHLAKDPATAPRYKHLVDNKGTWRTRDDVYIHYLQRAFPSVARGISGDKSVAFHIGLASKNKDFQRLLHAREYIRMRVMRRLLAV